MAELVWEGKYDAAGNRIEPSRIPHRLTTTDLVAPCGDRDADVPGDPPVLPVGWRNRLILGDAKDVLPSLGSGVAGQVDLIYIDPPFATGGEFRLSSAGGRAGSAPPGATAYRDAWGKGIDRYLAWFYETAALLKDLLAPHGSLYVHLDANAVHYAKVILDELFPGGFQREIVWRIGWVSGYKSSVRNYVRNHDTILFYTRTPGRFTFHKQYVPYPEGYCRRGSGGTVGKGVPLEDVWNASDPETALTGASSLDSIQIRSFSTEKTGYPTQKSEALLHRIISASSNQGDLVLDCCCGSGTTAAAAEKLGRRWIASDVGAIAIAMTRDRLARLPHVRPFALQIVEPAVPGAAPSDE